MELLFDTKQAVTLAHFPYPLIEKGPNLPSFRNDKSLKIAAKDLISRFWPTMGHIPRIIDASIIDAKEESL